MIIEIEGYLTQQKLRNAIYEIMKDDWIGDEVKISGYRFRYDFAYRHHNHICYVEFDGFQHYQNAVQIVRDKKKDKIVSNVIRFPYWIQLTSQTLKLFFNLEKEIRQSYPHGFIDSNALLPASFCTMGVRRFEEELLLLPENIKLDVLESLEKKMQKI